MGGPSIVTWRGVRVDPRTRDMLDEVAKLTPKLPYLTPSQGSYSTGVEASAGTHAGGGAVDIRASNLTAAQEIETVRIMRTVGFAAWRRLPTDGPWPTHIHGVAVGCKDLSPAAARQVTALRNGRNGLANNGPDPHADLGLPVITWEQYLANKETVMELTDRIPLRSDDQVTFSDESTTVAGALTSLLYYVVLTRNHVVRLAVQLAATDAVVDALAAAHQGEPFDLDAVRQAAKAGAELALDERITDARVELVVTPD